MRSECLAKVIGRLMDHSMHDREVILRNANRLVSIKQDGDELGFHINLSTVQEFENSIRQDRVQREQIEQMLRMGATVNCMQSVFGLDKRKIASLRKVLQLEDSAIHGGVSEELCDEVRYVWKKIYDPLNLPRSLIQVSQRTGVPIGRIWAVVQEDVVPEARLAERL